MIFIICIIHVAHISRADAATGAATCFCKVSWKSLWGLVTPSDPSAVVADLTGEIDQSQVNGNDQACSYFCMQATLKRFHNFSVAQSLCNRGVPDGTDVRAFEAVGTGVYQPIPYGNTGDYFRMGFLVNKPQVATTTCTCPPTWTPNVSVTGNPQLTADGKCKKDAGAPMSLAPLPPNGTAIGNVWGYTSGNQIYGFAPGAGHPGNCTCPTGWSVTTQFGNPMHCGCKKSVPQPFPIGSRPPNGTPIGAWGFTWGGQVIAWGSAANGGGASCQTVVISPAHCGWK